VHVHFNGATRDLLDVSSVRRRFLDGT
jgi:hypothetical protein